MVVRSGITRKASAGLTDRTRAIAEWPTEPNRAKPSSCTREEVMTIHQSFDEQPSFNAYPFAIPYADFPAPESEMIEMGVRPLWFVECPISVVAIFSELSDATYFKLKYYTDH
jgi:hypothetical protein